MTAKKKDKPPPLVPNLVKWVDFDENEWFREITAIHYDKIRYNRRFREAFERLPFDALEQFFDYDNYFITPEALWNILSKHYLHDSSVTQRKFTIPLFELLQLILDGKTIAPQPLRSKKLFLRTVADPNKVIGKKSDGTDTTIMTIITNLNGQIMTAFPATSKRFIVLNPDQIKSEDDIAPGDMPTKAKTKENFYEAFFKRITGRQ